MKAFICLYLLFTPFVALDQSCEHFDRSLFHMLSKEVGDHINCKDSLDRKQGWWIYYKVKYNPTPIPDELDSGNYVPAYRYGKYSDDKIVGQWTEVQNVHLIYESRIIFHYYKKDTLVVNFNLLRNSLTSTYIGDSAIKEYEKNFSN